MFRMVTVKGYGCDLFLIITYSTYLAVSHKTLILSKTHIDASMPQIGQWHK